MQPRNSVFLPALLGVACLLLAWQVQANLGHLPTLADSIWSTEVPEVVDEPLPPEEAFQAVSLDVFQEVLARPLFDPDRRPAIIEVEDVVAPPPPLDFQLAGVIMGDGFAIALLQPTVDGEVVRARQGEEVLGWVVKAIEPMRIVVTSGDQEQELRLDDK